MKTPEQIRDEKKRLVEWVNESREIELKCFEDKEYAKKIMQDFGIEPGYVGEEPEYSVEEYFTNSVMTAIDNCAKYCGVSFDEMKEWLHTQI